MPLLGFRLVLRQIVPTHGLRILMLHDVPARDMAALDDLVGGLARAGRLASPADAEAMLLDRSQGDRVLLTFDDGFASNFVAAKEVLARHGATAIFFVCPGLVELPLAEQRAAIAANIFDGRRSAADLPDGLRLMNWDELERLRAAGHVVANHTLGHRRLSRLSPGDIEAEIAGAADALLRRLGTASNWFAYPFGDVDSIGPEGLAAAGRHHRFCRSGVRGLNGPSTHPLAVLADHLDLEAPSAWRRLVVEGGLDRRYAAARNRLNAKL